VEAKAKKEALEKVEKELEATQRELEAKEADLAQKKQAVCIVVFRMFFFFKKCSRFFFLLGCRQKGCVGAKTSRSRG
jgi:hypothetical protein